MTQCCYQCPDREIGCHSVCERYAAYREEVEKARKQREHDANCRDVFAERYYRGAKHRQRVEKVNANWRGKR